MAFRLIIEKCGFGAGVKLENLGFLKRQNQDPWCSAGIFNWSPPHKKLSRAPFRFPCEALQPTKPVINTKQLFQ